MRAACASTLLSFLATCWSNAARRMCVKLLPPMLLLPCSKKLGYVPERDEKLEVIRPSFQVATSGVCRCVCYGAVAEHIAFTKQ